MKLILLLAFMAAAAESFNVLVVFPKKGKSHGILGDGYVRALLSKGHQVTYITPHQPEQLHVNLTVVDVRINEPKFYDEFLTVPYVLAGALNLNKKSFINACQSEAYSLMNHENVRSFLNDTKQHFDVVIAEWMWSELYSGFAALYHCPLIWSSSLDVHSLLLRLVDDYPNPAYTVDVLGQYTPPFSFLQRAVELWNTLEAIYFNNGISSKASADYLDIFDAPAQLRGVTLPPFEDAIYNGSLLLSNAHPSLGDAPRLPQNVKNIGGYHIDKVTKPLPSNLQEIMDKAKHGVIYFSLGSIMRTKGMPEQMKSGLLKTFGSLKQTVLWKYEEDLPNVPENVHILKWAPQSSILAHPNMKIFVTHGGLLSNTETIHHGVPTIGIPLFADQFQNVERAVKKGYAEGVKFTLNLGDDLRVAIDKVLGNESYAARAVYLSSLYHDRPLAPADELVYWVEHVVRTRGAPHLRSAALLLPWYSRLYLDLMMLVLAALLVTVLLIKTLLHALKGKNIQIKDKSI